MKTVLVTAYDVNPYKGSESGMGWNFTLQLARFNRVIAVTRENNRPHIERYVEESGLGLDVEFHYFDWPKPLRFWKRGARGSSLYFYLWQLTMPWFVRRRGIDFDIAHNLNFHTDWAPSLLWTLGKPLVWGPIGHHPRIPFAFIRPYGWREWAKDRLKWAAKRFFWACDPLLRATARKADLILCSNSGPVETLKLVPEKVAIHPSVGTEDQGHGSAPDSGRFELISVGRLVPLKGFDIAIAAFAEFLRTVPETDRATTLLTIVGSGPSEPFLRSFAASRGVLDNIRWVPWLQRHELAARYRASHAFLFLSHEGAGMVVAEALSFGLPVICFDNIGPGELTDDSCAIRVPYRSYDESVGIAAAAIGTLYRDQSHRRSLALAARRSFAQRFDWNAKGDRLQELYATRLA